MLLFLGDGTRVPVTELPGRGPWTFVVLHPDPRVSATSDASPEVTAPRASAASGASPEVPDTGPSAASDPEPGGVAGFITRFGRAVVPDLRGRPGWGEPPGSPGFLDLVDDLDQVQDEGRARPADPGWLGRPNPGGPPGRGRPAMGLAGPDPCPTPARPAPASLDQLDLPALVLDAVPAPAVAGSEEEARAGAGRNRWMTPGRTLE